MHYSYVEILCYYHSHTFQNSFFKSSSQYLGGCTWFLQRVRHDDHERNSFLIGPVSSLRIHEGLFIFFLCTFLIHTQFNLPCPVLSYPVRSCVVSYLVLYCCCRIIQQHSLETTYFTSHVQSRSFSWYLSCPLDDVSAAIFNLQFIT
jgi:hypothetical protein